MYKSIICLLLVLLMSGCSFIHRADIDQGNIITPEMTSRLHRGMTEMEVREVMGNAVLVNIFSPNRIDYIYTSEPGNGKRSEKRVTCIFVRGHLQEVINSSV